MPSARDRLAQRSAPPPLAHVPRADALQTANTKVAGKELAVSAAILTWCVPTLRAGPRARL